ncbi:MAG: lipoyl(octanoyl) transferase LipB [Candidatus Dadabacteria bacterium]|nr:MAG: lipoyl(octanoyl) transferase LipB [Candidatus Dadabacteria bacterium]
MIILIWECSATMLVVKRLGLIEYKKCWELQKETQQALMRGKGEDTLYLCEHTPVVTTGTRGLKGGLLVSEEELAARGIALVKSDRGGDITYHGPGQLVVYPVIDLRKIKKDVGWYIRGLENVVVNALYMVNIKGVTLAGLTGVWTYKDLKYNNWGQNDCRQNGGGYEGFSKIASIGIRISRWCTMHGIALNVLDQREGFSCIDPCGLKGASVTSVEDFADGITVEKMAELMVESFREEFGFKEWREECVLAGT